MSKVLEAVEVAGSGVPVLVLILMLKWCCSIAISKPGVCV